MLIEFRHTGGLAIPPDAAVVVGAGAAGIALALALADRGRPVVLVESGPDTDGSLGPEHVGASDHLNQGVVQGLPFGLTAARTRGLGGTTRLWHGQCMRLHEIDVLPRTWVPHSGWPLDRSALDGHYAKAERFFCVIGEQDDAARWAGFHRPAPLPWRSERLLDDATEYAPEPDLARLHGAGVRAHRLITTVVGATVGRVLVDDDSVVGLEVHGDGGRQTWPARQVVLAAGAVENARLLQLSDPAGVGLGAGREHTGRFLQTHPVLLTAQVELANHALLQDRYTVQRHGNRRLFPKVRLAPEAQARHELLDATAVFRFEHDQPAFAATRRLRAAVGQRRWPVALGSDLRLAVPQVGAVLRDVHRRRTRGLGTGVRPTAVSIEVWLEQQPDPDSRQQLSRSTDAFGLRQAEVRWRVGEAEIRTSRVLTRWLADDLAHFGGARTRELAPMSDDDAWRAALRDGAHPSGGTRMSVSAATGVVDSDLKVHGLRGLYVVGGSVFPTAGYANPTLTIVALALRLADHLLVRPGGYGRRTSFLTDMDRGGRGDCHSAESAHATDSSTSTGPGRPKEAHRTPERRQA